MDTKEKLMAYANDIPKLAKGYAEHINGVQAEAKLAELLQFLKDVHQQLRSRGTILVKQPEIPKKWTKKNIALALAEIEDPCPRDMKLCPDGTCVPADCQCSFEL